MGMASNGCLLQVGRPCGMNRDGSFWVAFGRIKVRIGFGLEETRRSMSRFGSVREKQMWQGVNS